MLFDLLVGRGAARVTLNPLDDAAVAGLIADILGAAPDPGLVALASGAAGNPLLLTELMRGLQDEHAIQVRQGAASVVSPRLPQRLRAAARRWLGRLSRGVGHMLETAAVLGRAFRLDDVAEMLGRKPAVMLPLANEAVAAGLLLAGTESFTFRHELIWRAVTEDLPPSARQALHRQFGGILLDRGGAAASAAAHLLEGVRQSDRAVMVRLDTAADEVLQSHPQAAADLAVRALDLTPAADPYRFSRTVRAAGALTAAARLPAATAIVRTGLAQPQPPAGDAQLRCILSSILCLEGRATEADAEAEAALAEPSLMAELRDEALIVQLQALAAQGENSKAYSLAESILTAFGEHGEPALAAALSVLAAVNWDDGRVDRGLRLASDAARRAGRVSPDARHFQPLFAYAAMLVDLRRLERADLIILAAREIIQALSPNVSEAIPAILGARVNLARGRTDDARVKAETALTIAETFGARSHSYLAHSVLSVIALRSGDLRTAGLHVRNRPDVTHYIAAYAPAESLLARAQFVEAAVGPDSAMRVLGGTYAALPVHRHVLIGEPTASAWLARTALAAGQSELATGVARVADELARDNPGLERRQRGGCALRRHRRPEPGPSGGRRGPSPRSVGARLGGRGPRHDAGRDERPRRRSRAPRRRFRRIRPGRRGAGPRQSAEPIAEAGRAAAASGTGRASRRRLGEPDRDRARRRRPGRTGADQPAGRTADVCEWAHRGVPPEAGLPQARHRLACRACPPSGGAAAAASAWAPARQGPGPRIVRLSKKRKTKRGRHKPNGRPCLAPQPVERPRPQTVTGSARTDLPARGMRPRTPTASSATPPRSGSAVWSWRKRNCPMPARQRRSTTPLSLRRPPCWP